MKKLTTLMITAMVSLNFACMVDRPYDTPVDESLYELNHISFSNNTDKEIDIFNGLLMGDIGPIKNIDNSATIGGFHDDNFTSLEIIMTNRKGSAMVMLSIDGGIAHADLVPNSVHRFGSNTTNINGLAIGAIVCSGEGAAGNWDYDDIASLVEVEVEQLEEPSVRRLNFTTYTEDDVATGHLDVSMEE